MLLDVQVIKSVSGGKKGKKELKKNASNSGPIHKTPE